jgi:subtilisin-like proprotein convertase family protein
VNARLSNPLGRRGGWFAAGMLLLAQPSVPAQPPPESFTFSVGLAVPDGDLSGLADTRHLPNGPAPVQSVAVTLQLSPLGHGGFFGDLYATLTRLADGYAVLLNRSGRSTERPFGYSDGGPVHLTLTDAAPADIHRYRLELQGDENFPVSGALTGLWQPDGRTADPLEVLDTHPRTAMLASFSGAELAGEWTLFVADVSAGGEFRLDAWTLEVTYIPEPGSGLLLGLVLSLWVRRLAGKNSRPARRGTAGGGTV